MKERLGGPPGSFLGSQQAGPAQVVPSRGATGFLGE
jgi:hypothetical protein